MFRIHNNIIKKENKPYYSFNHYQTSLYYKNKKYDLTEKWYDLDIHIDSVDINHIQTNEPIRKNLIRYLNLGNKEQHNGLHFARSIINCNKYDVLSLSSRQLNHLRLFDKIGLINNVYNRDIHINHETIYIGKHYNQDLFMSKLGGLGIYFMTFNDLSKLYKSFDYSLMVYRPYTGLLTYNNYRFDSNIRRDHNYDNEKLL